MNTKEFNSIANGQKVKFQFSNIVTGKTEIHAGTVTHIFGECVCIADETQPGGVYLNYRDVYIN